MNTFVIDLRDLGHENLLTLIFNTMVSKEIVADAMEMTKDIPANDVLVPLQLEETELAPYPEIEYMIIEAGSIEKVVRDVNTQLQNGWQTEWGIQVINAGTWNRYYQSMIRWNVDGGLKPEMPCKNSEAGAMGPKPLYIPGLEDEPDLYEDITEDATNW